MASLLDLITAPTKAAILEQFIGLLRLAGFPVSSWHSGSLQKHTAETESDLLSELGTAAQKTARAPFIRLAAALGPAWVELNAYEAFDEEVKEALATQGRVTLGDGAEVGPITKQPGTFWVANPDRTLRYVNVEPFTIPLNGTVTPLFQAESPGIEWNVGVGAITEILTPDPGVTLSNPALESGTWVTRQGTNRESPEALIQRCIDKWSTLGSGSNDAAYRYWALTAPEDATDADRALWAEVTRVRVYSPAPGSVRIVIAGPSGPVSAAALAAVSAHIRSKRPSGVWDVVTLNATVKLVPVGGQLVVAAGLTPAAVLAKAQAAAALFASRSPIGGTSGKISREVLIHYLVPKNSDGLMVTDLQNVLPAADVVLTENEIFVPSFELTAVYA